VGVAAAVLDEGLAPQEAVDRPRAHRTGDGVNAEPGVDEAALTEIERRGLTVRRWANRHHYFGGVSLVGRGGAAADPRRSGLARSL
jgi:gamma-glutamyltranspeptidase